MPAVEGTQYTRPEEFVQHFYDDLKNNAGPLGIAFVGAYDEKLSPNYPAVVVSSAGTEKELHATHTYLFTTRLLFYVMHGDMTQPHAQRNQEDLELATRIVDFIERDKTLDGKITFGYVESEIPGVMGVRNSKSNVIASTRLHWRGISEGRF